MKFSNPACLKKKKKKRNWQATPCCAFIILCHFKIKHSFTYPKTLGERTLTAKKTKNDYFS